MERNNAGLPDKVDIVIVGAGPVGLTVANYLGLSGVSTLILEARDTLIDYPRGVGMDDECLRSFQAIGLGDAVAAHTTPDQEMRFLTMDGKIFASIEPTTREFGWPRRNSFIQPMIDQILYEGLARFDCVTPVFGAEMVSFEDKGSEVVLKVRKDGEEAQITTGWLVGCDGGRSVVRKTIGTTFEGITDSTRWVVVDLLDDPIGRPGSYFHCIPERPFVSIALPHGMRRLEFMVYGDETEEELTSDAGVQKLLARAMPEPARAKLLRARVYTHNARLAGQFKKGRALLVGDAAHLMPVWQGQGYNSGIRDASNVAWKLAMVAKGLAGDGLLDTYNTERRDHAKAMIDLSVTAGKVFSPTRKSVAWLRDKGIRGLNAIPAFKRYIVEMKFKPMPRYEAGAILTKPGGGALGSATGKLFPQPWVIDGGVRKKLDDAIGPGFAILSWGTDPQLHLTEADRARWAKMGAKFVALVPDTQWQNFQGTLLPGTIVLGDADHTLHLWFANTGTDGSVIFLRPDRFVAGIVSPLAAMKASGELLSVLRAR